MHSSSMLIATLDLAVDISYKLEPIFPICFRSINTALTPIRTGGLIFLSPINDPFLRPSDKSSLGKILRISALLLGTVVTAILFAITILIIPLLLTGDLSLKIIDYLNRKNISEMPKETVNDFQDELSSPLSTVSSSPVTPTPLSLNACDSLPLYRSKLDIVSVHEESIGVSKHTNRSRR